MSESIYWWNLLEAIVTAERQAVHCMKYYGNGHDCKQDQFIWYAYHLGVRLRLKGE